MRWPSYMIEMHGKGRHQLAMVVVEGGDVSAEPRTIEWMKDLKMKEKQSMSELS